MQRNDVIYKKDAIEAIACAIWHYPNLSFLSDYDHAHELAEDALKHLSSAEPEQKTGKWIEIDMDEYKAKCSSCGIWSPIMGNYCPNCGAQMMRGDTDDEI